ncbi:hypothetical protein J7K43_07710 [Candidatus Calescamantes bacterium]|nr:hypothetical protein [Candidatus Calescamantes bacterium]
MCKELCSITINYLLAMVNSEQLVVDELRVLAYHRPLIPMEKLKFLFMWISFLNRESARKT